MKNPERVAALLAELRTLTENDFERHRIDVLERDLHEPPVPEVVDDTHQRFNGVTYTKNHNGHYRLTTNVHRDVWTYYNGEIPEGHQIHHIDEDKANNTVENLQCLTPSEHQLLHWQKPRHIGAIREFICDNCGQKYSAVDNGRNRYCSECKSQIQYAPGVRRRIYKKQCPLCGKNFETKYKEVVYCSRHCSALAREQEKRDEPHCRREAKS